ncbi:hypothetical protein KSS87_012225 [Heliosperma pusillum]|nr:hypothetical protein KSS87_012225 [Heliosperma pusillum]
MVVVADAGQCGRRRRGSGTQGRVVRGVKRLVEGVRRNSRIGIVRHGPGIGWSLRTWEVVGGSAWWAEVGGVVGVSGWWVWGGVVEVPNNGKGPEKLIDTGHIFNIPDRFYESRLHMIDEIKSLGLLHNIDIHVVQHFPKRGFGEQTLRTKEDIMRMTASKIGVSNILIDLGNKGIKVTPKQVYNVRATSKNKAKQYRTGAEQLLKLAVNHGYRVFHQTTPIVTKKGTHELTDVLFAHPGSLNLLKAYPHVLLADCTYNTNKYKMPLLEVIKVTPVHKNFSAFFSFLQNEKETAYDWAFKCLTELLDSNDPIVFVTDRETTLINAIEKHFLRASLLLCRRHIEKDVEAWVKKNYYGNGIVAEVFAKGKWSQMVRSTTEEELKENEELMYTTYRKIRGLRKYCKETWLDKYKERFVSAWTNKVLHFGNVTANRVESAHASLKKLLRTSVGGFDTVFETIHELVNLQIKQINEDMEISLSKQLHVSLAMSVYRRLSYNVTHQAIKAIDLEFKKVNCNGCAIKTTHGLPCTCDISRLLNTVHPFWRILPTESSSQNDNNDMLLQEQNKLSKLVDVVLKSDVEMIRKVSEFVENLLHPVNIIDPKVKKTRGRPKKTSVSRKPSHWEYIEKRFSLSKCKRRKPQVTKVTKGTTISEDIPDLNMPQPTNSPQITRHTATATSFSAEIPDLNKPYYMSSPRGTKHKSLFPCPDAVNNFMVPWIVDWVDVDGDGNCGYRAVAQEIYGDEDKWPTVRRDMVDELKKNRHIYIKLYGSEFEVDKLIKRISWWEGDAPVIHWMEADMGFIIANCYDAIFTCLSLGQSLTSLPVTQTKAISQGPKQIISIVFISYAKHFIWVTVSPEKEDTQNFWRKDFLRRRRWPETTDAGRWMSAAAGVAGAGRWMLDWEEMIALSSKFAPLYVKQPRRSLYTHFYHHLQHLDFRRFSNRILSQHYGLYSVEFYKLIGGKSLEKCRKRRPVVVIVVARLVRFLVGVMLIISVSLATTQTPSLALTEENRLFLEAWRTIDRAYVDKTFNGQSWFRYRENALRVDPMNTREQTYMAIRKMVASLDDPFTRFLEPEKLKSLRSGTQNSLTGVGLSIGFPTGVDESPIGVVVISAAPGGPASRAGISPGDIILAIDDASTESMGIYDAANILQGPEGSSVELTIRSRGELKNVVLKREKVTLNPVKSRLCEIRGSAKDTTKVGYIKLASFTQNSSAAVKEAIETLQSQNVNAFVLDLRDNSGGLFPEGIEVAKIWMNKGVIVYICDSRGVRDIYDVDGNSALAPSEPLAVLVNKGTASASEILAGALQDNKRAVLYGEPTYGKGKIQSVFELSDGSGLVVTVARYETPAHTDINKVGIKPDHPLPASFPKDENDFCTCVQDSSSACFLDRQQLFSR